VISTLTIVVAVADYRIAQQRDVSPNGIEVHQGDMRSEVSAMAPLPEYNERSPTRYYANMQQESGHIGMDGQTRPFEQPAVEQTTDRTVSTTQDQTSQEPRHVPDAQPTIQEPTPATQPLGLYGRSAGPETQSSRVTPLEHLGEVPANVDCPNCQGPHMTTVTKEAGNQAMVWSAICCICLGCLCAWIPCVMDSCKDTLHTCSNCKRLLATVKASGGVEVSNFGRGNVQSKYAQNQYQSPQAPNAASAQPGARDVNRENMDIEAGAAPSYYGREKA